MNFKALLFASISLFTTSAFAEFSLVDMKKAADVALDGFQLEYPDHLAHFTGFAVAKAGDDATVTISIGHHGSAENFKYLCLKLEAAIECRAEEN